jgi:hypothetical protein
MASEQAVLAIDNEQDQIRFSNRICHLGSGLIDQSQKATAAAIQIADK